MSKQSYCGKCGVQFEEDCDFCTECGSPKTTAADASSPSSPHQWMHDAPTSQGAGPSRAGDPEVHSYPRAPYRQPSYPASSRPSTPQQQMMVVPVDAPPHVYDVTMREKAGAAQASLAIGIGMLSLAVVALIPCLGWLNWLNLLALAEIQQIVWWISLLRERGPEARRKRLMSLPFLVAAVFISTVRLILGGGCL